MFRDRKRTHHYWFTLRDRLHLRMEDLSHFLRWFSPLHRLSFLSPSPELAWLGLPNRWPLERRVGLAGVGALFGKMSRLTTIETRIIVAGRSSGANTWGVRLAWCSGDGSRLRIYLLPWSILWRGKRTTIRWRRLKASVALWMINDSLALLTATREGGRSSLLLGFFVLSILFF